MEDIISYYQIISWKEDSYGLIECRIVISDKYEGLFVSNEDSTLINILNIESITKSVKDKTGGIEQNELLFSIKVADTFSSADYQGLEFIKEVESNIVRRFIGVFVNTSVVPDPNDLIYTGMINQDIESEDLKWKGNHFDININAIRNYKFKSTPIDNSVFGQFSVKDIIHGNKEKNISGIDAIWELSNVKNRQGFYQVPDAKIMVYQLVNLNDLLRKITDNFERELRSSGYVDISIKFAKSRLDGNFHPARWKQREWEANNTLNNKKAMYVESPGTINAPAFQIYEDDYYSLYINPDGKPSGSYDEEGNPQATYSEDTNGVPNNPESIQYARESIWLSYGFVKGLEYEYNKKTAEKYRIDKYKTYFELLNAIASYLGLYLKVTWLNTTELEIKFVGRTSLISKQIILKSATKGNLKPSNNNIEDVKYTGESNYLAVEGSDIYVKGSYLNEKLNNPNTIQIEESSLHKELIDLKESSSVSKSVESTLLTLSPTLCGLTARVPGSLVHNIIHFPHNHYHIHEGVSWLGKDWEGGVGFHSAVYLFVPRYDSHPNSNKEAPNYFTPAALLSITYNNESKQYDKYSDYLNSLMELDNYYKMYEYNLEFPWFYGAKYNDIIIWHNIDLFNKFELDSINWMILEVKWNFLDRKVNIVSNSIERFSFLNITNLIEQPQIFTVINDYFISGPVAIETADTTINLFDVVSRKSNGNYEKAKSISSHCTRLVGIALNQVAPGEIIKVQEEGVIESEMFSGLPIKTPLFLRSNETGSNISTIPLTEKSATEDLYCRIGLITGVNQMKLSKPIESFIFE